MSIHLSGRGKLGEEDRRIFKSKVFASEVQQKLLIKGQLPVVFHLLSIILPFIVNWLLLGTPPAGHGG